MDDRALLNEPGGGLKPTHSNGGAVAAWLAECGMVALLPTEESDATDDQPPRQPDPASTQESAQSDPYNQPEVAVLIRLSAQKLWSEGRANPLDWVVSVSACAPRGAPLRHACSAPATGHRKRTVGRGGRG
jgi:hypothetical protein